MVYTTMKVLVDGMVKDVICESKEVQGTFVYNPSATQDAIAREWYSHFRRMIFGK